MSRIRGELADKVKTLSRLSSQIQNTGAEINDILRRVSELENNKPKVETQKEKSKIIPFPVYNKTAVSPRKTTEKDGQLDRRPFGLAVCYSGGGVAGGMPIYNLGGRFENIIAYSKGSAVPSVKNGGTFAAGTPGKRPPPFILPVMARPEEPLPGSIPDFRPLLQRDGLILLSWDKKLTEKGELYTAYWVTSVGTGRYFASAPMNRKDFAGARPDHKSYAAEDGVEFYDETWPHYIVHVAPELMMNRRGKTDARPDHIKKLKALGIKCDFDFKFLLTKQKKRPLGKNLNPALQAPRLQ